MKHLARFTVAGVTALVLVTDAWLFALRCSTSPPIDWSRLGFAAVLQFAVLAGAVALSRSSALTWRLSLIAVIAVAFTFVLVREPLLLSDTTGDKFYPSGSYSCPGVPGFWRRGV